MSEPEISVSLSERDWAAVIRVLESRIVDPPAGGAGIAVWYVGAKRIEFIINRIANFLPDDYRVKG